MKPKAKQANIEDCIPKTDKDLNEAIDEAIVDFLADSGLAFQVQCVRCKDYQKWGRDFHPKRKVHRRCQGRCDSTYGRAMYPR